MKELIQDLNLTPEEQAAVRSLEVSLSQRSRFALTLDKLFHLWNDFVNEVEAGYGSTVDEYLNDLSTRDLLDKIVNALSESGQHKVMARIRPIDERFAQATEPDVKKSLEKFFKPGPGWWWSR